MTSNEEYFLFFELLGCIDSLSFEELAFLKGILYSSYFSLIEPNSKIGPFYKKLSEYLHIDLFKDCEVKND